MTLETHPETDKLCYVQVLHHVDKGGGHIELLTLTFWRKIPTQWGISDNVVRLEFKNSDFQGKWNAPKVTEMLPENTNTTSKKHFLMQLLFPESWGVDWHQILKFWHSKNVLHNPGRMRTTERGRGTEINSVLSGASEPSLVNSAAWQAGWWTSRMIKGQNGTVEREKKHRQSKKRKWAHGEVKWEMTQER